jgi:rhamnose utilization protein RhaD (predicted bifunctional aldolase and dehydrogenase)
MDKIQILDELVRMSLELGKPENDYVILGEGNTSARIDDGGFYVKASGTYLSNASRETFVEVDANRVLELLDCGEVDDEGVKDHLASAVVGESKLRPSVETVLHAFCLQLPDVNFIGHTHPTAVNAILCSENPEQIVSGRIFPDEIVYCGIRPVYIPYVDPGVELAREVKSRIEAFIKEEGVPPKVILMQNHGQIGLGKNAQEVLAITAMWVKTARVLAGAQAFGGARYFTKENVQRIYTRPDELYRRGLLERSESTKKGLS